MAFTAGIFFIITFFILIHTFGVFKHTNKVLDISKNSLNTIQNTELDDQQKEIIMQKNAKDLLLLFFFIIIANTGALIIPSAAIWMFDYLGILSLTEVINCSLSISFILTAIFFSTAIFFILKFLDKNKSLNTENQYTTTERILHKFAFSSWSSQSSLASFESNYFENKISPIKIDNPVFITGLPRAGTTLLLELCVQSKEFTSHSYKNMPFVMIPLFWEKFSSFFARSDTPRERAHGDGMMISVESPEAFEEIIWNRFWPSRYRNNLIVPWSDHSYPEFEKFFYDHIKKLLFLSATENSVSKRYISKNNLNISRIDYLKKFLPNAIIIVPFRDPFQHAFSLFRQHRRFLKIHSEDSFACRYMKDIGHYDFGRNLKPIDFNDWFSSDNTKDTEIYTFWLEYWVNTYKYLLKTNIKNINFFSYDSFCQSPHQYLNSLGKLLRINDLESFTTFGNMVRPPKPYHIDYSSIPSNLTEKAKTIFADLQLLI